MSPRNILFGLAALAAGGLFVWLMVSRSPGQPAGTPPPEVLAQQQLEQRLAEAAAPSPPTTDIQGASTAPGRGHDDLYCIGVIEAAPAAAAPDAARRRTTVRQLALAGADALIASGEATPETTGAIAEVQRNAGFSDARAGRPRIALEACEQRMTLRQLRR